VTGTLKDWDVTGRLGEIRVPTLVIGGRYDEATPAVTETVHGGIPGSEWVIFENSGHFPHLEETDLYLQVLGTFSTVLRLADCLFIRVCNRNGILKNARAEPAGGLATR
jgi:hypothetical protein